MFTSAIGREKSVVSNFEIRESDQKIFLTTPTRVWVGVDRCEQRKTTFSKIGHVG